MRFLIVIAVVAAVLTGAQAAQAAIYSGKASDGTFVKLRAKSSGKPDKVTFGKYKQKCTRTSNVIKTPITGFVPPFDAASGQKLLDRGRTHKRYDDGASAKFNWRFKATHGDDDHWRGHFRTRAVFFQPDGDSYSRCRTEFDFELKRR